ncbi:hypothetical protein IFM89_028835 [Coptis chinensis]|uniref:DUF4283 domain-containing protein n=1 Tax=Coptis chinensis TaxID=261450 RepID=A0A835HC50_9MAGN|nr:hypothetical protein IFM89_028835 [Coptis chinensis]
MDISEFERTPLARARIAEERVLATASPLLAPNQVENQAQRSTVSFADKVSGDQPQHLDGEDLPIPEIKGNMPSIKLPKKAVERGRIYCKYYLVGQLDLQKIKLDDVHSIAADKWNPQSDWKIIPLGKGFFIIRGKGFFIIRLTSETDWRRIWGGGPWRFGEQTLRLSKWTPDFDPNVHIKTKALIQIKFPKLGQQYWDYEILMSMGKTIGYPIGVDKHTLERDYGFYVSVLVDVDISKPIPTQIWVEKEEGISFVQDNEVVKMPKYCGHCKSVGHLVTECRVLRRNTRMEETAKEAVILGPIPVARKLNKKRRRNKDKQNAGPSGTKDSTGDYISAPSIATQPTAIDVEAVNTQVNAIVNDENNVGEQVLQEAQATHMISEAA